METTDNHNETSSEAEAPAQEQQVDWKAEARKWEARAKENRVAATKLAELEEAAKTTEQKQAEKLAKLEAENAAYRKRDQVAAWAAEITDGTAIPAGVLRGETREELQEHFDQLSKLITVKEPVKPSVFPGYEKEPEASSEGSWISELFANARNQQG